MPRVLVAIRMPDNLKRMIDEAAEKRGVTLTSFIVNACWGDLDNPEAAPVRQQLEASLAVTPDPMAKLLAIPGVSLGMTKPAVPLQDAPLVTEPEEIPICRKQWWEDGEQYECLMDSGHRETKHGQRGMVRRIEQ